MPKIELTVMPEKSDLPTIYANFCAIRHTPFDFHLTFCIMKPVETEPDLTKKVEIKLPVLTKLCLPVSMIQGLIEALIENYEGYKEQFVEIPVEEKKH
jgi:hypothetical protein